MNAIFVVNKPRKISSNHYLSRLKRKYKVKKAGFSGTLDPFASGTLVVAFGNYTRLFPYLHKAPKVYEATMWLGANSPSGDNENIDEVLDIKPFDKETIKMVKESLIGKIKYIPPKFSAKNINGTRAYKLARAGENFELKEQEMQVYSCQILHYSHPFLKFRISVSEGAYIRSYAEIFAKKLGVKATLSALHRVQEGEFRYENEKFLNPTEVVNLDKNEYFGSIENLLDGKVIAIDDLKMKSNGKYLLDYDDFFSIIQIENNEVRYCLNKVKKC